MTLKHLLVTLVTGALLAGCGSSTSPDTPPSLPLDDALAFDLETFPAAPGASSPEASPALVTTVGTNYLAAALGVTGINVAVVSVTAVPRATWAALASQQPTLENGKWHWRSSTQILGVTYSGDLSAFTEQGDLVAEVRISSPAVSDFLWYDLHAPIGGDSGQWQIYDADLPNTPTVVGTIDWTHPATSRWTLTFTAVGGTNPGDDLEYVIDGSARSVSWYDASAQTTYGIGWDAVTHTGYIQAAGYNNGVKSCWDATLQNVACP
jgi:hypothetical protein